MNTTILILIIGYFLPTIIAGMRLHPNSLPIFLVDLVFGWTLLGWMVALIWSVKAIDLPAVQEERQ